MLKSSRFIGIINNCSCMLKKKTIAKFKDQISFPLIIFQKLLSANKSIRIHGKNTPIRSFSFSINGLNVIYTFSTFFSSSRRRKESDDTMLLLNFYSHSCSLLIHGNCCIQNVKCRRRKKLTPQRSHKPLGFCACHKLLLYF